MKNFYASMFISLMCALSAQAAVIQVTSDKSGTELQAAVNAASSGDTLKVQAGTYYGNFTMKEGVNVIGVLLSWMQMPTGVCFTKPLLSPR